MLSSEKRKNNLFFYISISFILIFAIVAMLSRNLVVNKELLIHKMFLYHFPSDLDSVRKCVSLCVDLNIEEVEVLKGFWSCWFD